MKLNNKILYLTTASLISTLIPANTNAQTFYQCMPITCSDGQYIKDGKCTSCPAGTFQKGNNRATSCTPCSAGTYSSAGASSCKTCEAGYACNNGTRTACATGYYQNATGQSSCKKCSNIEVILSNISYVKNDITNKTGGCQHGSKQNVKVTLSPGSNIIGAMGIDITLNEGAGVINTIYSFSGYYNITMNTQPKYTDKCPKDSKASHSFCSNIYYSCSSTTGEIDSIIAK